MKFLLQNALKKWKLHKRVNYEYCDSISKKISMFPFLCLIVHTLCSAVVFQFDRLICRSSVLSSVLYLFEAYSFESSSKRSHVGLGRLIIRIAAQCLTDDIMNTIELVLSFRAKWYHIVEKNRVELCRCIRPLILTWNVYVNELLRVLKKFA